VSTPDQLSEVLSRLRTAHRVAGIGSWEGDVASTGDLSWSPELHEITGWPSSRAPTYGEFVALVHPDDRPHFHEVRSAALRGERPFVLDVRMVRPDGVLRHVHIVAEVVRNADGTPVRLIGVVQDRTEEIESLRQLRITETSRRQLLERLLDAAEHERERFAKQLATGPIPDLEALERRMAAEAVASEGWSQALDSLRRSIESLQSTLTAMATDPESGDLAAVVDDLVSDLGGDLDIDSTVAVEGPLPVRARSVVVRIVQEALQNARKHASAGTAEVQVRSDGPWVHVRVADDGCGFDPAALRSARGHLGIASLRDELAAIGGHLDIRSRPGETVVRARVPLQ
jgi:PAS domain S-box-containing protein